MKKIIIVCFCLVISGCSTFSFVFERLDLLALWQLDRMFNLTEQQETQLGPVVVTLREHIRNETFPVLISEFKEVDRLWNDNQLEASMNHMHGTVKGNAEQLLETAWPLLRPTLLTFTRENLDQYKEYTEEEREEWFKSTLSFDDKLESRITPLEDWFGDLTDAQVEIVRSWIEWAPNERKIRINNNDNWIGLFTRYVLARDAQALNTWSQDPSIWWTEEFSIWRDQNEKATKGMLTELFSTLTDRQKRHASERIREWIELMEEVSEA